MQLIKQLHSQNLQSFLVSFIFCAISMKLEWHYTQISKMLV